MADRDTTTTATATLPQPSSSATAAGGEQSRKSFYIIDGHAQIYRAYFAPFRNLTSPDGEPTKATFVFTQMLLNLVQQRKPDYLAMVIDAPDAGAFRKQLYPDYKANRKETPSDFFPQEQRIIRIVRDAGVPIFCKPGCEADDLIATIAQKLCDRGFDIYLVSRDKDLRQILGEHIYMYDPQADEVIDAAKLRQKLGYGPEQAVEVQTLTGDPTDNVPGIPGVGEKTAARLIQRYGSVENILAHVDELTPKLRESFKKHAENLKLSRQLVTLRKDVDFDFDPEQCVFRGLNLQAIRPHLEELGFRNLLKRLSGGAEPEKTPDPFSKGSGVFSDTAQAAPPGQRPFAEMLFPDANAPNRPLASARPDLPEAETYRDCTYLLIDTEQKFADFVNRLRQQKRFAFDTETDALGAMQSNLIGMSFAWEKGCGYYVPVRGPAGCQHLCRERVLRDLKPILEDENIKKVGHNLKYDLTVMRQAGVHVRGVELDTMIAAFLLDSSSVQYGIDRLAMDLLHFRKIATEELIGKGKNQISMGQVDLERVAIYAAEDADIAMRLAEKLGKQLDANPALRKLNDEVEVPLIEVLVEMETNGIAIDPQILKQQSEAMAEKIEQLRRQIFAAAGNIEFNPDSPKQLADVLFNKLGLKVVKRTKTGPSTDIEVLDKLAGVHPVPKLILEYRSLMKLKNTYLDNLPQYVNPKTGRIHASFSQIGAATGRLSCSEPNLQNIPIRTDEGRRIRSAFVPGDREHNVLLTADYSQIELRFLAHFTEEPALIEAFEKDQDIHRAVAAEVFGVPPDQVTREQRAQAKIINFGIIYGVSAYGLARRIEGMSTQAAAELIAAYHKRFPRIRQFLEQCVTEARTSGYVQTILGRRRNIPDINANIGSLRSAAERMAINSVVQGSAADLIKIAMNRVYRRLKRENRPSRMLLQVHDELVFETPADQVESDAQAIRQEMCDAMKLRVPLKVDIGWARNWQEVK
ncbi:DNA polymerase I [Fontivita pretiosa]|uniref:DNA polymerase I n=1 Tax=Fontivita pretiosa TaxID=2989684 RepID=UPI003D17C943